MLRLADKNEVAALTEISAAAFNTDYLVGGEPNDGPPGYDSADWHGKMQAQGRLFAYEDKGELVGGAVLFTEGETLRIGRIFISPDFFRRGYGCLLLRDIEELFPKVRTFELDTPVWNVRTNALYRKMGYVETGRSEDIVSYRKKRNV